MSQKYDDPDKIPDEAIVEAFASVDVVSFSSRNNNCIQYRKISIGDLGWWLPLERVLPLLGITPQMLRPVFITDYSRTKAPEVVERYEELGSFWSGREPFVELAKILGKKIEVLSEDGGTGDHRFRYIACPSGEIIETREAVSQVT